MHGPVQVGRHEGKHGTVRTDDGVTLAFRSFGDGPQTVLLQPGWTHSGENWNGVIEHMDLTGLRVVALDPRGCGASEHAADGYTLDRLSKDILAVADGLGAAKFHVAGHSLGGKIVMHMSAMAPSRVLSQVLLSPAPPQALPAPPELIGLLRMIPGNRMALWMLLGAGLQQMPSLAMREAVFKDMERCSAPALAQMLENCLLQGEFMAKLKDTTAATLFLATDDPVFTRELLAQVSTMIPRAALTYLPGPGHWPTLENPAATAAILRGFFTAR